MAKFGVGQPVRRVEDQRFITGGGRYADDIDLEGQAYLHVVRSPEAHARIRSIDIDAARAAPGVLAITGTEYAKTGGNALPCGIPMENRDGSKGRNRLRPVLCTDRVRHVGDNVAFVVAETPSQAKDAAELVVVEYDRSRPWRLPRPRRNPVSLWCTTTCPAMSPSTGSTAIAPPSMRRWPRLPTSPGYG